ncbi:hypothetical protein J6TS2_33690 [Heyndrickxia sporothermodurans]|nr:hypothetical protein J6TS2_33690 [Heyndrickxia sporothermodurans]
MKIVLTGINFNYDTIDNDFNSVNLNFTTTGATFKISNYIQVTKEQYEEAGLSNANLISLIKQEVIKEIQAA